eukprot:CAMPEP_0204833608 /NCGR_PEP_ID=MMETSP1346-20131115/17199_1 /ASSEMBLY_ACC=CAM_ASM_000771 /TAXON_ID=215587 /ORGANISM="Aplanochytrium stocchinoi, Strain GSBS06" /LENGTH=175 /DNA_ID=CAMNT_0051966251 /DNA_START=71 /DNA_END=594 /DNA_ORIENTATION=+
MKQARPRNEWGPDELGAVLEGVKFYGRAWHKIKKSSLPYKGKKISTWLANRTPENIKDKEKNMKNARSQKGKDFYLNIREALKEYKSKRSLQSVGHSKSKKTLGSAYIVNDTAGEEERVQLEFELENEKGKVQLVLESLTSVRVGSVKSHILFCYEAKSCKLSIIPANQELDDLT